MLMIRRVFLGSPFLISKKYRLDELSGLIFLKPQITQITLIFSQLQIYQIAQKFWMRKRINLHRLTDARHFLA